MCSGQTTCWSLSGNRRLLPLGFSWALMHMSGHTDQMAGAWERGGNGKWTRERPGENGEKWGDKGDDCQKRRVWGGGGGGGGAWVTYRVKLGSMCQNRSSKDIPGFFIPPRGSSFKSGRIQHFPWWLHMASLLRPFLLPVNAPVVQIPPPPPMNI